MWMDDAELEQRRRAVEQGEKWFDLQAESNRKRLFAGWMVLGCLAGMALCLLGAWLVEVLK